MAAFSFHKKTSTNLKKANLRFMIDTVTYRKLHQRKELPVVDYNRMRNSLTEEEMKADEPPSEDFLFLLPPSILGFNMLEKRWINLRVDTISSVKWNDAAFESVAMDVEDKHMVKALVSTKLEEDRHTDVMEGKGNGLIILLHGGPGTGKTITAESVAEIAKKPLYNVTCGDVGTDPEKVEEYLETVFMLGRIWDCGLFYDICLAVAPLTA